MEMEAASVAPIQIGRRVRGPSPLSSGVRRTTGCIRASTTRPSTRTGTTANLLASRALSERRKSRRVTREALGAVEMRDWLGSPKRTGCVTTEREEASTCSSKDGPC
jgi:hypothetical protein